MGKVTQTHRHNSIVQAHKRREKIRKLRTKLLAAEPRAREAIIQKLKKINAAPSPEVKTK